MKISLFIKAWMPTGISYMLVFVTMFTLLGTPSLASAGFFSDLVGKVVGNPAQAETNPLPVTPTIDHNSQNLPLLDTSMITPPQLKNTQEITPVIVDDKALEPESSPLGPDIENNTTSDPIRTYIVQKGNTLKSIAKKMKVTEDAILASNADIPKADLLKPGQLLVIIAIKEAPAPKKKEVVVPVPEENIEVPSVAQVPTPPTDIQPVQNGVAQAPTTTTPPVVDQGPQGQPAGQMAEGYIWIFPEGEGHISQMLHGANGIDVAAPRGTPILAVRDGTILIARGTGWNGAYGHYVVENFDNGAQGLFAHMDKVVVTSGQMVKQGDIIGYEGLTGRTTGPHVHFEVRGAKHPYRDLHVNATSLENND